MTVSRKAGDEGAIFVDEVEAIARIRLIRSENVGPVTFRQLIVRFGTARAAVEALPDLAARAGRRSYRVATMAEAEAESAAVRKAGARLLHLGIAPYPARLGEIEDAPPLLIARGDLRWLDVPSVAMVGARNASAAGMRLAREWAAELREAGLAVVSGMARGVDAAVHNGAFPATIACVAGGADVNYPPELADLQGRVAAEGLVLAEQPLGVEPQARHFPRRNRIISGLSLGVVVIEAAMKSGSLITARYAGEHGREVMAVPGSPLDPRAHGGNALIRDGATLVQSPADIIEAVAPFRPRPPRRVEVSVAEAGPTPPVEALTSLLGPTPVLIDELAAAAGLEIGVVQAMILDLELAGLLARHPGGRVSTN